MAFEHTRGTAFLKAKLAAASAVTNIVQSRIYEMYRDPKSRTQRMPYIIIRPIAPRDLNTLNSIARRILTQGIWDVKAVGPFNEAAVNTLADAIDAAIQGTSGTAGSDGYVYGCVRELSIDYAERDGDLLLRHIGGQYRLVVQIP